MRKLFGDALPTQEEIEAYRAVNAKAKESVDPTKAQQSQFARDRRATSCSASTDDAILAETMEILAETIVSQDGVANQAIRESGHRILELSEKLNAAIELLREVYDGHRDPESPDYYNYCQKPEEVCMWCENAEKIIMPERKVRPSDKPQPNLNMNNEDELDEAKRVLGMAMDRIQDLLMVDDGHACKEAQRFLDRFLPNEDNTETKPDTSATQDRSATSYTALIAINVDGGGSFLRWSSTAENWQKEDHAQMDMLGDYDFQRPIGIYEASMSGHYCADCFETKWTVGKAVILLPNAKFTRRDDTQTNK